MAELQKAEELKRKEKRGEYDFFNDRDRWQFLSKELAQKQELIHQTMKNSNDRLAQQREADQEILEIHQSRTANTILLKRLHEQLAVEDLIEQGLKSNLPANVAKMSLAELRTELISTALAYKGEQTRNEVFEKKLDGARSQLKRREETIQSISDLQEDNSRRQELLNKMEREKEKESSYAKAIEQQESVICKLEKLMEESIDSQTKAKEYRSDIQSLDHEITKLKSEA